MNNLLRDLQFGCRTLWKSKAFTLIAVFTLALGIGANTAVFSVVNALLLRALPYPQAEQLVYVWTASPQKPDETASVSPHNFSDLRRYSQSFDSYFAFRYTNYALTGSGTPESYNGIAASGDFARTMGVTPILGRLFSAAEDVPGNNRVAVISHNLWQRRYAGNPQIVGQTVQFNGEAHTILGVMPANFAFPNQNMDVWTPLALDLSKYQRGTSFLQGVARLKPGVTVAQAKAEVNTVAQQIVRENSANLRELAFNVVPLRKQMFGQIERPLLVLFGAVVLVLLIACVNVANLVLGRATVRWKELSVRAAMGASRWNLMRLLLAESVVLGLLGGGFGLLLASYGLSAIVSFNADALPKGIGIDGFVVAFTVSISVLTSVIFGLAPAWQASHTDLNQALRETSRTAAGAGRLRSMRSVLVVAEIGLSLVLLVSAGLLLKSFWKLVQVNPGFQPEAVVTANVSLPRAKYQDEWQQADFFRRTLAGLRAVPGVTHASAATSLPFQNSRSATSFSIDARPTPPNADGPSADYHEIFPDYFQAMGIPMKAGRDFSAADDRTRPGVVIINERAAQLFFPGEDPLGKRLTIGSPEEEKLYGKGVSREVVGVIGNTKLLELNAAFQPELYVPAMQMPASNMTLAVRGNVPPDQLINGMRTAVQTIDAQQPIRRAQLLQKAIERSVAPQRFLALLLLVFAGVALALALIGIYGVMSYAVTQRTQEIGIRVALGAQTRDVLRLVLGQGMKLIGIGIGAGLLVSFFLTQLLKELLYEVTALDSQTFGGVTLLLVAVALLACFLPARRAAKVDPMVALRCE